MLSAQLQKLLTEYLVKGGRLKRPAAIYVALFTTSPSDARPRASEIRGKGYRRLKAGDWRWNKLAQHLENPTAIAFPVAKAPWGPIGYVAFFDAPRAGNLLAWMPVSPAGQSTPTKVQKGRAPLFEPGGISFTVGDFSPNRKEGGA